ncbi:MAG: right-handed parallel beta-helix repeat-containing protein [Armatimonadota bacterium]
MKADFFVSPRGNDAWTGRLSEPDAAGTDGPFRTILRAQQAVRARLSKGALTKPLLVMLRDGTYFLNEPLVFTVADSGAPESPSAFPKGPDASPVIYDAFPGERPVLSGGRRITGWKEERLGTNRVWTTSLPEAAEGKWEFSQLFVNGSRRVRPRLPEQGFYRVAELVGASFESHYQSGTDRFIYADGDLQPSWRNLRDVEIVVLAFWNSMHMKIRSLEETRHLVTLDRNSGWRMSDDFDQEGANYYVENVFEALEDPGQWYLDRPAGRLYYLPMPGETLRNAEVIAPYLSEVVRFEGTADTPVRSLHLRGLTFSHTEWHLPPNQAMPGVQAAVELPGAVVLRYAQECRIEQCTFEHLGNYAVELAEGCLEVGVIGCNMWDLGGGGVKIRDGCLQNQVTDCEIGYIGLIFHASMGVWIGRASGNQVLHNHIHHLYQGGISVGWNWGFGRSDTYGNVIEYNHIHDFGQGITSDLGGIYTLGPQTGTRIRYNVIHDGMRRKYGDQGIYLDEGSSDILIEGNLVYRCQCGFSETGRDNIFRNNIFALNREYQMRPFTMAGASPHVAFVFENNIVYCLQGDLFYTQSEGSDWVWSPQNAVFRRNLYYNASGEKIRFREQTFDQWKAAGQDVESIIADPLFVDAEHGDFRLRRESPAFALGFREFDLSAVGPRPQFRVE